MGNKRWVALASAIALGVLLMLFARREPPLPGESTKPVGEGSEKGLVRRDFPANPGGGGDHGSTIRRDGAPVLGPSELPSVAQQIDNVMGSWRTAIVNKDADAVVAADGVFRNEPQKFLEALVKSAETDSDDRVRAFSTRVLGKLGDPATAPLLIRLLGDKSTYVRMNAAWGLGELAIKPEAHAAAKPALKALRRLEKQDEFKDTRQAAALAAKRLQ